jgi:polar amino acid transport system permease protein
MEGWSRFLDTFFNWMVIERYLPAIMKGVVVTIEIAAAVVVAGILFGLALAIVRAFRVLAVNALIVVFVDVFRALPPLVLILLVYFALPNIGISLPSFAVCLLWCWPPLPRKSSGLASSRSQRVSGKPPVPQA